MVIYRYSGIVVIFRLLVNTIGFPFFTLIYDRYPRLGLLVSQEVGSVDKTIDIDRVPESEIKLEHIIYFNPLNSLLHTSR